MARRRAKPKRRRSRGKKGVKLIPLAASYISASAITQMAFKNNLWTFLTMEWGGTGRGPGSTGAGFSEANTGQGYNRFTLAEIVKSYSGQQKMSDMIRPNQTFGGEIWDNIQSEWFMGGLQLAIGASMPKVLNKLPGRPVQKVNKILKQIGIGDVVKL